MIIIHLICIIYININVYVDIYFLFMVETFVWLVVSSFNRNFIVNKPGDNKRILLIEHGIQTVFFTIFAFSAYRTFEARIYNIKYSHWIMAFSMLAMFLMLFVIDFTNKRTIGQIIGSIFLFSFVILAIVYVGYNWGENYFQSHKEIALKEFPVLNKITVQPMNTERMRKNKYTLEPTITIDDKKVLEAISIELSNQEYENLRLYEITNYEKMKFHELYYSIPLVSNIIKDKRLYSIFRDSDITSLIIIPGKITTIEKLKYKDKLKNNKFIKEIYPVNLSEDTINKILNYVN